MKRLLCLLLVAGIITFLPVSLPADAEAGSSMAFTEEDLALDDNEIALSFHTTIGRGNEGDNGYLAQAFVPTVDYVTGCRLHFRLGDNATMTIQIRSSLEEGEENILYSANYPLVSNPHNITDWWDFEFTRAVKLTQGKTYYLVFWCDIYHSHCIASSSKYIVPNLKNPAYYRVENSDSWGKLNQRSLLYQMLSDPDANLSGFPYAIDDNTMMLHHAEELYCFNRHGDNTTVVTNPLNSSQGYFSLKATGGAPDSDGAVLSVYGDFDTKADLTDYHYFYVDLFANQAIPSLSLKASLMDGKGENGLTYTVDLNGYSKGWHRIMIPRDQMTALGNGSLAATAQMALQVMGSEYPADLYFSFDNLRAAKAPVAATSSRFYTDEQLAQPTVDDSDEDVSYIGKPAQDDQKELLFGDTNNDKRVDSADALMILRCSVNKTQFTGGQFKLGDVDANNQITATDALYILRHSVGKLERFPAADQQEAPIASPTDFVLSTQGLQQNTVYSVSTEVIGKTTDVMPHDAARLASSLQGLINRELKTNRVALVIVDKYANTWMDYIKENDPLLEGMTNKVTIRSFKQFLTVFEQQLKQCGMVLWDPDAPSTANVAATICGLDGYLPVKYDTTEGSLYNLLVEMGVETKLSLVDKFTGKGLIPGTSILSTGSIKCDPYLWALEKYSSRCSSHYLMYLPDGASATVGNIIYENDVHSKSLDYNKLFNHDYGVLRKAFFFDLTPIDTEAPCDDPTQALGTDLATLKEILLNRYYRANGEFGEVVGFPPWALKYATHNGWGSVEATSVEASFTLVITTFNCYLDADGSLANCSLYSQFTLEESYHSIANHKPVTEEFDENTMYLYMYTGDYDSSPWAVEHLYNSYNDPARGSIPITWSFTPSLSDRIPMVFDYLYKNQTENDYFSASDSGVGYVRPQGLFQSESNRTLPDGDKEFVKINKEYFKKFDLDSVGFLIGTLSDKVCNTYNQFAPVGSNTNDSSWSPAVYLGAPYVRIKNGIGDPATTDEAMATTVSGMYDFALDMKDYHTAGFRTIKFSASDLKRTQEAFLEYAAEKDPNTTYKFVDYKTYFAMLSQSGSGRTTLD